jgi:hypothetical protein
MSARAIPQDALRERIVAAVLDAKKPVTVRNLAKILKVKKADHASLQAAVEVAVGAGQVYRWPDRGRSQYFWHVAPEQAAREAVLACAADQALLKIALSRLAAKKLPGFTAKRVESIVSALVAENELQAVPGFAGSAKLLVRAGDREAYFNAARSFIEEKIRLAGFDPAAFFRDSPVGQDKATDAKLTDARADGAALIIDAVRTMEPVKGVPVSTLRLRNRLPHLSKHEFDAAALELRKKQQVFLSQHADPYNLSQEDKDLLIDGQDGTYYVAIAIR